MICEVNAEKHLSLQNVISQADALQNVISQADALQNVISQWNALQTVISQVDLIFHPPVIDRQV